VVRGDLLACPSCRDQHHTFATDLYRETKNTRPVQKALEHASLGTTIIYTHIVDEELEDALRKSRRAV
jgi:integrase/recombinase XerD